MAMGRVPGTGEGAEIDDVFAEINSTPLTDIFLVLLISFMVTSSVIVNQVPGGGGAKAGLKVNLPKGGASDVRPTEAYLSGAILADGRIVLPGSLVTEDELDRALAIATQKNPQTMLIVQADEGVTPG